MGLGVVRVRLSAIAGLLVSAQRDTLLVRGRGKVRSLPLLPTLTL